MVIAPDQRGKNKKKTISPEIIESVKEHINLFPRVPAHYCRKDTEMEYLDSDLNVRLMHKFYLELVQKEKKELVSYATERQYRDIFGSFKLSFDIPKKDQCDECFSYKFATDEEKQKRQEAHDLNLKLKNKTRDLKDKDKQAAIKNPNLCSACFDMDKI